MQVLAPLGLVTLVYHLLLFLPFKFAGSASLASSTSSSIGSIQADSPSPTEIPIEKGPETKVCLFFYSFWDVGEVALAADLITAWTPIWGGCASSRPDQGFQIPPGGAALA